MNIEHVLSKLDLKTEYDCGGPTYRFWNDQEFMQYATKLNLPPELKELDEIYQISDYILLHLDTGIRIKMTLSENSYNNDVGYSLQYVFAISKDDEYLSIEDIDLDKRVCQTSDRIISFDHLKKD